MWTWSVVRVNSREDFHKLKIKRLQLVRELDVGDQCNLYVTRGQLMECKWTDRDWIELFELLLGLPGLVKIRRSLSCFWDVRESFSFIEPSVLVNVFKRLEEICLGRQLSSEQSEQLLTTIVENKSCVKVLKVSGFSISKINPELFASAVINVDEVVLETYNITHEQIEAIFTALSKDGRRLRKLKVSTCRSLDIKPALMGEAVNRLEEFTVVNTSVTVDQLTAIMVKIVEGRSRLTQLMLSALEYRDFRELDFDLVKQVREKMGEFLYFDNMDSDDYEEEDSDNDDSEEEESGHND